MATLENPTDSETLQATVHRVAKSQTQLKRPNMHTVVSLGEIQYFLTLSVYIFGETGASLVARVVKKKLINKPACNAGDPDLIPGLGRSLGKDMATQCSFLPEEFHG